MKQPSSPGLLQAENEEAERGAILIDDEIYGQEYYDGEGESGYLAYEDGEWTAQLSGLFIDHLKPRRVLEVGCAKGFLVRRFRQRGIEAHGVDISRYAIGAAPDDIRPYVSVADILELPFPDDSFDLVLCMETLEHLPPDLVARAAGELARVCSGKVLASIPSFGFNDYGPQGLPILPGQREDAQADRPFKEITLDEKGRPHHGHLTLATYRWWTRQFADNGLYRLGWLERAMNADKRLHNFHFQIYALQKTSRPEVAVLWPAIKRRSLAAGRRDAAQLGPGFYHFDPGLGGRWTRDQALLFLQDRGHRWLYVEYMVPTGPGSLSPYVVVEGRKAALPESPGAWTGHHLKSGSTDAILPVLLGVERDWSPADISASPDENRYGIAFRYAALYRSNLGGLRFLKRRLVNKMQALFSPWKRRTTP